MNSSELVTSPSSPPAVVAEGQRRNLPYPTLAPVLAIAVLTIVGAGLRAVVANQSLFADELSTYWISATHGLGGVLSLLYSSGRIHHAEITPPLSFLASWVSTRFGHSAELLRAPALLAGTATIPLIYLLGLRTISRRAALIATALAALAPFMIYYSAEARAYGLMMLLVICSTLSMLIAIDTRRRRWWALYAVSSAAAFYTHYTCVFVLGAQLVWLLWAHPDARRAGLLANVGAAVLVVPWIPGLINDFRSPTLTILSDLSPWGLQAVGVDLGHWAVGYPYAAAGGLAGVPGVPALVLLAIAATLAAGGLLVQAGGLLARAGVGGSRGRAPRGSIWGAEKRIALVLALMLATPIAEAAISALGNHIFGVRNLAASWPFLALVVAAALAASGPRLGLVAAGLAVFALALGATKLLEPGFQRIDYQAAANYVAVNARPGDVVIDRTGGLSPGPLTAFDVSFHRRLEVFRAQAPAERDHPFGFADRVVPVRTAVQQAVRAARGARVFLVTPLPRGVNGSPAQLEPVSSQFPPRYRLVRVRQYEGIGPMVVAVYQDRGSAGR
jgi:hypothetical protein